MAGRKERFNVGLLMKSRKAAKKENEKIKEELTKVMIRKRELKAKRTKLRRLDAKVSFLNLFI